MEVNEIDEFKMEAYTNVKLYKECTKLLHDKYIMVRNFEREHHGFLHNSRLRLFLGKLKSIWSSIFTITQTFPHGAVKIKDEKIGIQFKVNR